jgi:putative selenium metabolism protein SsnA
LDAGGALVLPGLVNAHAHHYSALARGLSHPIPAGDFASLLRHLWWRLDAVLELEDVRLSAALAARDGLRRGVTVVFDHHASFGAIDGALDAVAEGLEAAGQRGVIGFEVSDRAGPEAARAALQENERFATAAPRSPFALGAMLGLHASFTLGDATLEAAAELVRRTGLRVHVHVAEDPVDRVTGAAAGSGVVARLERFGLLQPGAIAAHALHLDAAEIRRLAELDVFVAHNARSNMNNGVGRADLGAWTRAGVQFGLGTDGYGAGMLSEAHAATLLQRQAPRLGDGALVQQALLHANFDLAGRWLPGIGRLAPGCPADVVVTGYTPPTPLAAENFWGHLLFGAVEESVQHVFVAGERVLEGGRSTRLDEAELEAGCREHAARLWERFAAAPVVAGEHA